MFALEITRLPTEVASMLAVRNRGALPLRWQTQPDRRGKNALDEMADDRLFGGLPVIDSSMTPAVKALLYLWNGWPDDAKMHAQPARRSERFYVTAFCERMLGRWEVAGQLFRQVEEMPILDALLGCVRELSQESGIESAERILKELEKAGRWDHLAFTRLLCEAANGALGPAGEQLVSLIQLKEFELLFNHCYEEATSVRVLVETKSQPRVSGLKGRKREPESKPSLGRSHRPKTVGGEAKAEAAPVKEKRGQSTGPVHQKTTREATARVICPLCGAIIELPAGFQGSKSKCIRCGGIFSVAGRATQRPTATPPSSLDVVVCCPVCQTIYSFAASVRGSNRRCSRCDTVFSVSPE
jgi:hypothetical protein